jgi:hypothetical protein
MQMRPSHASRDFLPLFLWLLAGPARSFETETASAARAALALEAFPRIPETAGHSLRLLDIRGGILPPLMWYW